MKIYIWNQPYYVKYGGTFLFVAAETEEQARELAKTAPCVRHGRGNRKLFGDIPLGPPDRVIDAPGGECYWWSEYD